MHAMQALHVLFLVPAFLRRFVDDISDLFDAGCRHKIGIADGEVTKIRSVADLFFNLNRREMRKISVVNGIGADLGVSYAKSGVAVCPDSKATIKLRVTADFALGHKCRNACAVLFATLVDKWRAEAVPVHLAGKLLLRDARMQAQVVEHCQVGLDYWNTNAKLRELVGEAQVVLFTFDPKRLASLRNLMSVMKILDGLFKP
jgi:hypothetical protein